MTQTQIDRALRVVFVIWLVLLAAIWFSFRTKHGNGSLTDAQLQRWYEGANEEYFANKLPKNVTVKWGDLSWDNDIGLTQHRPDGSYTITIDPKENPARSEALLTLFHETCHIATWNSGFLDVHGPPFQTCMLRLAEKGAFQDLW